MTVGLGWSSGRLDWADEPLGPRELTGIALISLAGLVEFVYPPIRRALWRDS